MTMRSPAAPNLRSRIAADDGLLGRLPILRDDDALAGGEAVGLEHDRKAELAGAHRRERLVERLARAEARRRHVVPRHERLRECLARFEPRGRGGRSEEQPAFGRESIGDAEAQRQLGTDDGEVDLLAIGERQSARRDRRDRRTPMRASRAIPGISGRGDDLADVAIGGETGDQRVLARAAAENENSH